MLRAESYDAVSHLRVAAFKKTRADVRAVERRARAAAEHPAIPWLGSLP
jgi:hypothetical protein